MKQDQRRTQEIAKGGGHFRGHEKLTTFFLFLENDNLTTFFFFTHRPQCHLHRLKGGGHLPVHLFFLSSSSRQK
jgi:hypothetical protein